MASYKSQAKSSRRPLRDSSNLGRFSSRSVLPKKKLIEKVKVDGEDGSFRVKEDREKSEKNNDSEVDRIFLVHSELSTVLRQIDELVVQSSKLQTTGNKGKKDIESFRLVLSDILSSVKPWFPRFQELLSDSSQEAVTQVEQSSVQPIISEEEPFEVESPEQTKFESLISPSPLVSWRGDFNVEGGRQLFLLTPLVMSKAKSSKRYVLSAPAAEMITSTASEVNPLDLPKEASEGVVGSEEMNATIGKPSEFGPVMIEKRENENSLVSSPILKKKTQSELLMTPCLKMSPPKSCLLLEPTSQSCARGKVVRKSTPYPIGLHGLRESESPESSESRNSAGLALKYPELLGIQRTTGIVKKDLDSSPDWWFSPPKSCVLLEPSDEKSVIEVDAASSLPISSALPELKEQSPFEEPLGCSTVIVESTPLWKAEPESTIKRGRKAGESTLKRELWTKFEAASSANPFGLTANLQRNSKKGFLDTLEEVSGNEEASTPVNTRRR